MRGLASSRNGTTVVQHFVEGQGRRAAMSETDLCQGITDKAYVYSPAFTSLSRWIVICGQYRDWSVLCAKLGKSLKSYFLLYSNIVSNLVNLEAIDTLGFAAGRSPGLKLIERLFSVG